MAESHILGLEITTDGPKFSKLENDLRVIDCTFENATPESEAYAVAGIIEKLKSIITLLSSDPESSNADSNSIGKREKLSVVVFEQW